MEREHAKQAPYTPASRGPTDVERQDSPGTPPATDEGSQAAVDKARDQSSGIA